MLSRQAVFLTVMKRYFWLAVVSFGFVGTRCGNDTGNDDTEAAPQTPSISYTVVGTLPHDTSHFTEGLEFYNGHLIESTGNYGASKLVQFDPQTGTMQKELKLEDKFFGEGVTVLRDTVYQLTYREGVVYVYDAKTFKKIKQLPYTNGEGWGLTHDSTYLIATNSGNGLFYYEPGTFKLVKRLDVNENDAPAVNINELEYVNGYIYANQWQYPYILKIDPDTGNVVAKMDLTGLIQQEKVTNPTAGDLNGIAYNPETKKFYVTGKNWSKIYQLQFAF
jgi:glutaminyl-peptide cyclotransferase